jgi:hypothetical protein
MFPWGWPPGFGSGHHQGGKVNLVFYRCLLIDFSTGTRPGPSRQVAGMRKHVQPFKPSGKHPAGEN